MNRDFVPDQQMDQQIKAEWLDALKSGKYPKGKNALSSKRPVWDSDSWNFRDEEQFCCLGVLADVIKDRLSKGYVRRSRLDGCMKVGKAEDNEVMLPPHVLRLVGLTQEQQDILALINDSNDTFEPVIARIEEL